MGDHAVNHSTLEQGEQVTRMIAIGDQQEPYGDERAQRLVVEIIKAESDAGRPFNYCVDLGDRLDLDGFTTKFLREPKAGLDLRRVVKTVANRFQLESEALGPDCHRVWIEGNHEYRLPRYVMEAAPVLYDLMDRGDGVLTIPFLMQHYGADMSRTEYIAPYGEEWVYRFGSRNSRGEFVFTHGNRHNKYAAFSEVDDLVCNGMSGHLHRMQVAYKTTKDSVYGWWVNGALCNIEGDNIPPSFTKRSRARNWQQGVSLLTFSQERSLFEVKQVLIHRGRALVNGRHFVDRGGKD